MVSPNRNAFKSRLKCPNSMSGCRSEAGRLFQILGRATEKLLSPSRVFVLGTVRTRWWHDLAGTDSRDCALNCKIIQQHVLYLPISGLDHASVVWLLASSMTSGYLNWTSVTWHEQCVGALLTKFYCSGLAVVMPDRGLSPGSDILLFCFFSCVTVSLVVSSSTVS